MKILVTGSKGQLGSTLMELLSSSNHQVEGVDISDVDLSNTSQVQDYFKNSTYDVIIHTAGCTNVDECELDNDLCYKGNVLTAINVLDIAKRSKAKIVMLSSDYVFAGSLPFKEAYEVTSKTSPISNYGKAKEEIEKLAATYQPHFIVRTATIIKPFGNNFIEKLIMKAKETNEIKVVDDQVSSVGLFEDIAKAILILIEGNDYGIHHIVNEGAITRYELAKKLFALLGYNIKLVPISKNSIKNGNIRPANSALSTANNKYKLPSIDDALIRYVKIRGKI